MQKVRAFLSVVLCACIGVLGAAACEDSNESTFDEKDDDAGDAGGTPGFNMDGAAGDDGAPGGPVDCKPRVPGTFTPAWKPPTKAAVCEAAELGDYYDACVNVSSADAGAGCTAWKQQHADCSACLEPADNNGPIQFYRDRLYYGLNVAGCLAILRDEPQDGKCPAAYATSIQCQRESCDWCLLESGAAYSDFQKCQQSAKTTDCKSYEDKRGQVCGTGLSSPDSGVAACFRPSGEDERTHFVRVEGLFCGK